MPTVVNHRRLIAKGRVFNITAENITLDNGHILDLEIIRHPGASAIVPVTGRGEVLMLKQYRHAVGGHIWEIRGRHIRRQRRPCGVRPAGID